MQLNKAALKGKFIALNITKELAFDITDLRLRSQKKIKLNKWKEIKQISEQKKTDTVQRKKQ